MSTLVSSVGAFSPLLVELVLAMMLVAVSVQLAESVLACLCFRVSRVVIEALERLKAFGSEQASRRCKTYLELTTSLFEDARGAGIGGGGDVGDGITRSLWFSNGCTGASCGWVGSVADLALFLALALSCSTLSSRTAPLNMLFRFMLLSSVSRALMDM